MRHLSIGGGSTRLLIFVTGFALLAGTGAAVAAASTPPPSPAAPAKATAAGTDSPSPVSGPAAHGQHFVTTWGSSMQGLDAHFLTDTTIRMIARVSVGGASIKVRLSNAYGPQPLRIQAAAVGIASGQPFTGSSVRPGTITALKFSGSSSVTIPPGQEAWSDAAPLAVPANTDIAVSMYLPGASVPITDHTGAVVTSFYSNENAGNHTGDTSGSAFTQTTTAMFLLDAVAVKAPAPVCAVVAFGDSITDGTASTIDGHNRWEDFLARRVDDLGNRSLAIVNEGIGGNTVTASVGADIGPKAIDRQSRDVLSLPGVCDVIVFMGTNDIAHGATPASAIIAGLQQIISKDKAAGFRTIGVTIIPRDLATGWVPATMDPIRDQVNAFIRNSGKFDGVIDFDALLKDPQSPNVLNPLYGSDDHIHPNPYGYFVMGSSVPLNLLH
ncbi:MAG: GDSL-type esterase/lipase family protein [Micromonosporaceae bacterium]